MRRARPDQTGPAPSTIIASDSDTYSIDLSADPWVAAEQLAELCGGRQRATEWLAEVQEALS